jgi:N-acetyl-anhydromuramyl-L-alanine amidase AmpD
MININDLADSLPVHATKKPKFRELSKIKKIVVHCTDGEITPQELARYDIGPNHIDKTGLATCTYHYYIGRDGAIARLVSEAVITAHAALHNSNSLAICLAFKTDEDFESGRKLLPNPKNIPTGAMMLSLVKLLAYLCIKFKVPPDEVFGHRELLGTGFILVKGHKRLRKTCPSMSVDLDVLRELLKRDLQKHMKEENYYSGEVDGKWGPQSKKAFANLID